MQSEDETKINIPTPQSTICTLFATKKWVSMVKLEHVFDPKS